MEITVRRELAGDVELGGLWDVRVSAVVKRSPRFVVGNAFADFHSSLQAKFDGFHALLQTL